MTPAPAAKATMCQTIVVFVMSSVSEMWLYDVRWPDLWYIIDDQKEERKGVLYAFSSSTKSGEAIVCIEDGVYEMRKYTLWLQELKTFCQVTRESDSWLVSL